MSNYSWYLLTKQLDVSYPEEHEKRFVPRNSHPILNEGEDKNKKIDIQPCHVEQLYGVMIAQMLLADTQVPFTYNTFSWFNHNAPAVDIMPRDCLQDLTWLLHFVDDWELDDNDFGWDEVFDYPEDDQDHDAYAAAHRVKFGLIEDAFVQRWQQCVLFGRWITADKSCLVGLYHSPCMIGPNPKPIQNWCYAAFTCYNEREATVLQTICSDIWW